MPKMAEPIISCHNCEQTKARCDDNADKSSPSGVTHSIGRGVKSIEEFQVVERTLRRQLPKSGELRLRLNWGTDVDTEHDKRVAHGLLCRALRDTLQ